jgi:1-acyl-sn-glycerol-3-phosphate acyltransferase
MAASSIVTSKLYAFGADRTKPFARWRRWLNKTSLMYHGAFVNFFICWMWVNDRDVDVDYSEYLGPNWRAELKAYKASGKQVPTIVQNHSSFFDIFLMMGSRFVPSFVAASHV